MLVKNNVVYFKQIENEILTTFSISYTLASMLSFNRRRNLSTISLAARNKSAILV